MYINRYTTYIQTKQLYVPTILLLHTYMIVKVCLHVCTCKFVCAPLLNILLCMCVCVCVSERVRVCVGLSCFQMCGVWSCILCGDDEEALESHCPKRCRLCVSCYTSHGDAMGKPVPHTCRQLSTDITNGIRQQVLCFPDLGKGKKDWQHRGGKWRDPDRGMWLVEDSNVYNTLIQRMSTDHRDPELILKDVIDQINQDKEKKKDNKLKRNLSQDHQL